MRSRSAGWRKLHDETGGDVGRTEDKVVGEDQGLAEDLQTYIFRHDDSIVNNSDL